MSGRDDKPRAIRAFRVALTKELVALFRVGSSHPGIERILDEAESHLEELIDELVRDGATIERRDPDGASPVRLTGECGALLR